MTYIKQFDAVRAIAVLLVIVSHWFPHTYFANIPFGSIGVDVFFVLSGFLITRILLVKKNDIDSSEINQTKFSAVLEFMVRRALRIFPVYYILLVVLFLGAKILPNPIPEYWEYYALYLQNFVFYFGNAFQSGKVAHLWSLAVEEQFYLIWPWVLLFINPKHIKKILIFGIFIGTLSSILLPMAFPAPIGKKELSPILTLCCLQSFCLGGLLSYWSLKDNNYLEKIYKNLMYAGIIAMTLYAFIKVTSIGILYFDRILFSVLTTWIFASILLQKTTRYSFLLENKILIHIGKISYGIYLYHNFIPVYVKAVFHIAEKKTGIVLFSAIVNNSALFALVCATVLWIISFTSFQWIEKPFLKIKDKKFTLLKTTQL